MSEAESMLEILKQDKNYTPLDIETKEHEKEQIKKIDKIRDAPIIAINEKTNPNYDYRHENGKNPFFNFLDNIGTYKRPGVNKEPFFKVNVMDYKFDKMNKDDSDPFKNLFGFDIKPDEKEASGYIQYGKHMTNKQLQIINDKNNDTDNIINKIGDTMEFNRNEENALATLTREQVIDLMVNNRTELAGRKIEKDIIKNERKAIKNNAISVFRNNQKSEQMKEELNDIAPIDIPPPKSKKNIEVKPAFTPKNNNTPASVAIDITSDDSIPSIHKKTKSTIKKSSIKESIKETPEEIKERGYAAETIHEDTTPDISSAEDEFNEKLTEKVTLTNLIDTLTKQGEMTPTKGIGAELALITNQLFEQFKDQIMKDPEVSADNIEELQNQKHLLNVEFKKITPRTKFSTVITKLKAIIPHFNLDTSKIYNLKKYTPEPKRITRQQTRINTLQTILENKTLKKDPQEERQEQLIQYKNKKPAKGEFKKWV